MFKYLGSVMQTQIKREIGKRDMKCWCVIGSFEWAMKGRNVFMEVKRSLRNNILQICLLLGYPLNHMILVNYSDEFCNPYLFPTKTHHNTPYIPFTTITGCRITTSTDCLYHETKVLNFKVKDHFDMRHTKTCCSRHKHKTFATLHGTPSSHAMKYQNNT